MTHDHRLSPECLPMEELASLVELPPGDPRLTHIKGCVRCRNLVASLRSFQASRTLTTDRALEAKARLRTFLVQELELDPANQQPPRPEPFWRHLFTGPLRPILWPAVGAVAALCVVLLVLGDGERAAVPGQRVVRDVSPRAVSQLILEPPVYQEDGGTRLSWQIVPQADAYRVILYSPSLDELARFDTQANTALVIPAQRLAAFAPHGPEILWQAQALSQGAELIRSQPAGLQLP